MRRQVLYFDGEYHPCYFFWKEDQQDGYLSNWYKSDFFITNLDTRKQIWFDCSEQYFMWQKARLFHDDEIADLILKAAGPAQYKSLGQRVKNFDQALWDENKYLIMYDANYYKFTQNADIKEELLQTGDAILAEASPYDKIWGIGLSTQGLTSVQDSSNWIGENLLGKVLMHLRTTLKEEGLNQGV